MVGVGCSVYYYRDKAEELNLKPPKWQQIGPEMATETNSLKFILIMMKCSFVKRQYPHPSPTFRKLYCRGIMTLGGRQTIPKILFD